MSLKSPFNSVDDYISAICSWGGDAENLENLVFTHGDLPDYLKRENGGLFQRAICRGYLRKDGYKLIHWNRTNTRVAKWKVANPSKYSRREQK